ncbi:MAG: hypothetical protein HGA85_00680 [Nanoarchaeota archaeon]|nr:hypothetical protein [Nanoarchaeota archaeon]
MTPEHEFALLVESDAAKAISDPGVPKIWGLPEVYCAGYCTRAAKILYGLNFYPGSAWELPSRKPNLPVWTGEAERMGDILDILNEKDLMPGDILGLYNPTSAFNEQDRPYTHAAVYLGQGVIAHQWKAPILKSRLEEFLAVSNRNALANGLLPARIMAVIRASPENKNNFEYTMTSPGYYKVNC